MRSFGRSFRKSYVSLRQDSSASAEYVPYILPQEHGNHTGVRSLTIDGLTFEATENAFEANVSQYTVLQLDRATHIDEIGESDGTHLRIDYRNSGVGSQSCGPELAPEHRITEKQISFAVSVTL